jgi:hypothetical protein
MAAGITEGRISRAVAKTVQIRVKSISAQYAAFHSRNGSRNRAGLLDGRELARGCGVSYIEELKDVIRRLHGADATHVGSVPVKEQFQDKTVWDGVVEVFDLIGHPNAFRVYAWAHATDNPQKPVRHVTVLHLHPVQSAQDAVRAAILQEAKDLGTQET